MSSAWKEFFMTVQILSANVAGGCRNAKLDELVSGYSQLIQSTQPQILLLQEAARELEACNDAGAKLRTLGSDIVGDSRDLLGQLAIENPEYRFYFAPAVMSHRDSPPEKWQRTNLPPGRIRAQGCAVGVHQSVAILDFWTGEEKDYQEPIELNLPLTIDKELGIYSGTRDDEARIAQGLRVRCEAQEMVCWNVHLTTLFGEREQNPLIDERAAKVRARQLDALMVSHEKCRVVHGKIPWVIAGDFNAKPEELLKHETLTNQFQLGVYGPTRPNGTQVDNILLEQNLFPSIVHDRARWTSIYMTQAQTDSLSAPAPPKGETPSHLDAGRNDEMEQLMKAGADHFPLVATLPER